MAIKLSTGKIAFPIEFDNGDVQNIYFNPSDPDFPIRLKDFQKKTGERMKELDDIELTPEGTPKSVEMLEKFYELKKIVCEELDYAFSSDISQTVFKHCSPFAIVDGEHFITQFLKAIKPVIIKEIKKSTDNMEKRLNKHVGEYIKDET